MRAAKTIYKCWKIVLIIELGWGVIMYSNTFGKDRQEEKVVSRNGGRAKGEFFCKIKPIS